MHSKGITGAWEHAGQREDMPECHKLHEATLVFTFFFLKQKLEALGINEYLDAATHTCCMDWCCCVPGLLRTQQKPRPPSWSYVQGMTSFSCAPLSSTLRVGRKGTDLHTHGGHTGCGGESTDWGKDLALSAAPLSPCLHCHSLVFQCWVWRPVLPFSCLSGWFSELYLGY